MLEVGTTAPEFTLPDQNGTMHSLADYLGQKVVLYFYPKDMTSGCTSQACSFADRVSRRLVRSTYLIDEQGIIVRAFGKVKAKDNARQMLNELV